MCWLFCYALKVRLEKQQPNPSLACQPTDYEARIKADCAVVMNFLEFTAEMLLVPQTAAEVKKVSEGLLFAVCSDSGCC